MNPYNPQIGGVIPESPPPPNYKTPILFNAHVVGFSLFILEFFPALLNVITKYTVPLWGPFYDLNPEIGDQIFSLLWYSLSFGAAIAVALFLLKMPKEVAFPLRPPRADVFFGSIGISMGAVIFGGFLTNGTAYAIERITGMLPSYSATAAPRGVVSNVIFFISVAVLPALLEEGLFRGVVLQSLRRYGDSFALVVSSVLFGIIHGNFIQMPYTLFLGLIIGYFVLYTGSIWPGVAIHFVNNGTAVLMDLLKQNTTKTQELLVGNLRFWIWLFVGGISLVLLRRRLGSLFYIPPSRYPLKESTKYIYFFASGIVIGYLVYAGVQFWSTLKPAVAL